MRLSNELVYNGALQCANDDVACAKLASSVSQKQVCQLNIYMWCIYMFLNSYLYLLFHD